MNSFVVSAAVYNGTSGDPNPLCCITGTVNGKSVFPLVFFGYLSAANAAGQMQAALTPVMFNWYANVYGFLQSPWPDPVRFPQFPASCEVAEHIQGPFPQPDVEYSPALIGSWTV